MSRRVLPPLLHPRHQEREHYRTVGEFTSTAFGGSPATPNAVASPVPQKKSAHLREEKPRSDNVPIYPALKPVYQTANSIKERSPVPSHSQPTSSWIRDQSTQSSANVVPKSVMTNSATSRSARHHPFGSQKPAKANSFSSRVRCWCF